MGRAFFTRILSQLPVEFRLVWTNGIPLSSPRIAVRVVRMLIFGGRHCDQLIQIESIDVVVLFLRLNETSRRKIRDRYR
jgi:hypothetical protein